ncbi:MAG TPA: alpha/beta hydrolase [Gaiella sp.]|nr:alpha/beta hydrolase [Gaiella sp.]
MAILETSSWNDPAGAPVLCVHGVTAHRGRFAGLAERLPAYRVVAVDLRGHGSSTWEAPWTASTHLADLSETADALGIGAATWIGHSYGGRLVAALAAQSPERVERAVLLDPAMHVDPAVASERAEGLREDLSFGSPDEAIDARLGDGSLVSTPRSTLESEAEMHLEQDEDGRWRWRFSPPSVIAAWSEMASPAPPWPECPTLVVIGAQSWIPNRVPRLPHLTSVPVPGGHTVLWDDPVETAAAVARFLGVP